MRHTMEHCASGHVEVEMRDHASGTATFVREILRAREGCVCGLCNRYDSEEEDLVPARQKSSAYGEIVEVGFKCMALADAHLGWRFANVAIE